MYLNQAFITTFTICLFTRELKHVTRFHPFPHLNQRLQNNATCEPDAFTSLAVIFFIRMVISERLSD